MSGFLVQWQLGQLSKNVSDFLEQYSYFYTFVNDFLEQISDFRIWERLSRAEIRHQNLWAIFSINDREYSDMSEPPPLGFSSPRIEVQFICELFHVVFRLMYLWATFYCPRIETGLLKCQWATIRYNPLHKIRAYSRNCFLTMCLNITVPSAVRFRAAGQLVKKIKIWTLDSHLHAPSYFCHVEIKSNQQRQ